MNRTYYRWIVMPTPNKNENWYQVGFKDGKCVKGPETWLKGKTEEEIRQWCEKNDLELR